MAKKLTIGEFCGTRRELPRNMKPVEAETSRLLDGLKKNSHDKRNDSHVATAFRELWEGSQHV
jgi:hypothetical protein